MSTHLVPAPSSSPEIHRRPVFDLFEGYALSSILAGLEIAGLLPVLEEKGLPDSVVRDRPAAAAEQLTATLGYLSDRGIVGRGDDGYVLTDRGRQICADKGYLLWLVGGYGGALRHQAEFVTGAARYGHEYTRDGEWVAGGAAMLGRSDVVPYALELLRDVQFRHMVDIGCGNARFLLLAAERFGATGVGVDLSPEACELARENIERAGMGDQVEIFLGDAVELAKIPRLDQTDLVVTFFLLHEVLAQGRPALISYLKDLHDLLPGGARLLVAEVEPPESDVKGRQWFTPEFRYVHAMMSQILYPAEEWVRALTDGGFEVTDVVRSGMPGGLVLLGRKRES